MNSRFSRERPRRSGRARRVVSAAATASASDGIRSAAAPAPEGGRPATAPARDGARPADRLSAQAADALLALLPQGAEHCDWLFAGPPQAPGAQIAEEQTGETQAGKLQSGTRLTDEVRAGATAEGGEGRVADWHGLNPADQQLGQWLRRHPSLGARERRWLSDRVYDVLRHGRAYELFLGQSASLQARLLALIQLSEACRVARERAVSAEAVPASRDQAAAGRDEPGAQDVQAVQAARYAQWLSEQPPAVRYSLPDWIWAAWAQTHGAQAEALAAVMLLPASIDIRCNLLKGKASELRARLAEAGLSAEPVAEVPTALRLQGRPALARLPLFEAGWFELQDAGSQAIVDTCAPRRGERVVDFCAGAGGKTLGLAARMRNQGQMLAFDNDEARLSRLEPRLKRAGVSIVTRLRLDGSEDARLARYQGWADRVLVDAPCTGSGTFRRHPDLKWRLRPADVQAQQAAQREILQAAVRLLRPGGRLVYATCSLFAAENELQLAWFGQWLAEQGGGDHRRGGLGGATAQVAAAGQRSAGRAAGAAGEDAAASEPARERANASGLQLESSRYWLPGAEAGDAFFMSVWAPVSKG